MKIFFFAGLVFGLAVISGCASEQKSSTGDLLAAIDFAEKIIELPAAPIIDVRTASEFAKAHLQNAINVDINGGQFREEISRLDKSKPVFVYCLSGGRSASAVGQMRSLGFKEVYELEGGLMKWRAANLSVMTNSFSSPSASDTGMTKDDFEKLIPADKIVLVDFYADWCAPCKKMKPYLEEIAVDMKDKVEVVRINADDHPQLCKDLDVTGLPTLQLYKNKKLTWVNSGYLDKADVVKRLN
jgi:thioredoxin 1